MIWGELGYGVFAEVPRSPALLIEQQRHINRSFSGVNKSKGENYSLISRENPSKVDKFHRYQGPRKVEKSQETETPRSMSLNATSKFPGS